MKTFGIIVITFIFFNSVYASKIKIVNLNFTKEEPHEGFFLKRVEIIKNGIPIVDLVQQEFILIKNDTPNSIINVDSEIKVIVGMEKKKLFAIVKIPAFRTNSAGQIERLLKATLQIKEKDSVTEDLDLIRRNFRVTTASSVLSVGTWKKIAIANRGIYKIDYDFVKNKLGQSGIINSNQVRLFGNGGTMIHESNKEPRPIDLTENAVSMFDGADGIFGEGDYFLFYANGPLDWVKDSINQTFSHRTNLYSDSSYYFLTFNNGNGLRIQNVKTSGSPTIFVNSFNDYALHEKELVNLGTFGKTWWGETFGFSSGYSNNQNFSFKLPDLSDSIYYNYRLASCAIGNSNAAACEVKLNGNLIGSHRGIYGIGGADGGDPGVEVRKADWAVVNSTDGELKFNIEYTKNVSNAKAYLDFIEVNTRRKLNFRSGSQLSFRDWRSVGAGSIAEFKISGTNEASRVWDISNPLVPLNVNVSLSGGILSFSQDASTLHEYIIWDNNFLQPVYSGTVPNQDLRSADQPDYIIVSHPDLMEAANKLADFHRSSHGYKVITANLTEIFNEFSSGAKDISAIRDYVKMFYDRAGTDEKNMPKYLLLLGQASYDYKNIVPNNAKIVPTYETPESLNSTTGYSTDDFYAFLDSNDYIEAGLPLMDICVGRIPATGNAQALAVVDKIIRYKSKESLGAWRLNNIYAADREDGAGDFIVDTEAMSEAVESTSDIYRSEKIYLDNMNLVSTPSGPRAPEANKLINDNMKKGTFLMNYIGHGSIYSLSSKRIVTQDDYNSWNNQYMLPIIITGTCDFGRFDNPALQSAGEKILLRGNGGAIAMVTTTQVVYATPNSKLNKAYLQAQFTNTDDSWKTLGEAFRIAKNFVAAAGDNLNARKFALLGDPALIPNFPEHKAQTDSVKEFINNISFVVDSVKSLGRYVIYGSIRDGKGQVINNFDGKVHVSFYDKKQEVSAKTQNSGSTGRQYSIQNNLIYKGSASVKNGFFSFEFITPKDINYDFGKGKIVYYAENGITDAAGSDTSFTVGGFSENSLIDEDAPLVKPFMNDSLFRDGGLTGSNSILYTVITDESGINVSGNMVGHDLTAILDGKVEVPYVLNDYYESAPNNFKIGYVSFPLTGLEDGLHFLTVKAWDVFNNSGEGRISFEVLNNKIIKIRNLYNYPNPFKDFTHFSFEHNYPNEPIKATVNIYNSRGILVNTLEKSFTPNGSRSADILWNGCGYSEEKLPPGIYPYRIRIYTEKGIEDLGTQKIILLP